MSPPIRSWLPGAARRLLGLWWKPIPEDFVFCVRPRPNTGRDEGIEFAVAFEVADRKLGATTRFRLNDGGQLFPKAGAILEKVVDFGFGIICRFEPSPTRFCCPSKFQLDEMSDHSPDLTG